MRNNHSLLLFVSSLLYLSFSFSFFLLYPSTTRPVSPSLSLICTQEYHFLLSLFPLKSNYSFFLLFLPIYSTPYFSLFETFFYDESQSAQRDLAGAKNKQMMITVDLGIAKAKEVILIHSYFYYPFRIFISHSSYLCLLPLFQSPLSLYIIECSVMILGQYYPYHFMTHPTDFQCLVSFFIRLSSIFILIPIPSS